MLQRPKQKCYLNETYRDPHSTTFCGIKLTELPTQLSEAGQPLARMGRAREAFSGGVSRGNADLAPPQKSLCSKAGFGTQAFPRGTAPAPHTEPSPGPVVPLGHSLSPYSEAREIPMLGMSSEILAP